MPTSHPRTLSNVHCLIEAISPRTAIDIGVGHGKTAVLMREYLEMWSRRAYEPAGWRTKIYGIEIFERYRNPLWTYAYDQVLIGDALHEIDRLPPVDLAVCLDVWEHLERDYAANLLAKVLHKARYFLISTPIAPLPQDDAYGNPNERHVSHWSPEDFAHVPYRGLLSNGEDWCFVLSRQAPLPERARQTLDELSGLRTGCRAMWRAFRYRWWNRPGSDARRSA